MTNDNSRNPPHQLRAPTSTQNPQEDHIPHVAPPQPLRLRGPDVERGTAAADPDQTPHDVPAPLLLSDSNKGRCSPAPKKAHTQEPNVHTRHNMQPSPVVQDDATTNDAEEQPPPPPAPPPKQPPSP